MSPVSVSRTVSGVQWAQALWHHLPQLVLFIKPPRTGQSTQAGDVCTPDPLNAAPRHTCEPAHDTVAIMTNPLPCASRCLGSFKLTLLLCITTRTGQGHPTAEPVALFSKTAFETAKACDRSSPAASTDSDQERTLIAKRREGREALYPVKGNSRAIPTVLSAR